jgi:antitoxin (DNA-binding transcriptional repressor) of toxin-antitoxin stability system
MKTAAVQQVPQDWDEILRRAVAGEEVQLTEHDKVMARLVPKSASTGPDFVARAKRIWGEMPAGRSLSEIVFETR